VSETTDGKGSPTLLAKELAEDAINKGSKDNVSVVIILFRDFWT
jgi:serine/threonine protein phosphatase PrpC